MAKDTKFGQNHLLNLRGRIYSLERPQVMGILNLTPDSFYDGGLYQRAEQAVERCRQMLNEGADMIDVGAASSRPGAKMPSPKVEIERLQALKKMRQTFPDAIFSVDTFHSEVARAAADMGADIINDISGGSFDPAMPKTMAELQLPYVVMHIKGKPLDMQKDPQYENVFKEVMQFLSHQRRLFLDAGVNDLIFDPGFGFGKKLEHNYQLLNHLHLMKQWGHPILVGVSRKSMVNKLLGTKPENALNGTTVLHTLALQQGANILRVHDVKEARQVVKILTFTQNLD